jgi:hypothetical protein
MNKTISTFLALLICTSVFGGLPKAPKGYSWKQFKESAVKLRVPKDWHVYQFETDSSKVLQITKEEKDESGYKTGLTIQYIDCKDEAEYEKNLSQTGEFMSELHGKFSELFTSKVYDKDGRLNMILEGTRELEEKNDGIVYRTRTCVRAFHDAKSIYIYVFGAQKDDWEKYYEVCEVMLGPIVFKDASN